MAVSTDWLSMFFVGFSVLTLTSTSHGACPNSWIHLQDHGSCYKLSTTVLDWTAAKSACEVLGTKLVVINSEAEQQAIAANVRVNSSQSAWIGLRREAPDSSSWLWVDGSRLNYTYWSPGEPNNFQGEECAVMYPESSNWWRNWTWNDQKCNVTSQYICETNGAGECSMSNGGCSHKCVNTVGGYKCECPDPGLILSLDNKTCEETSTKGVAKSGSSTTFLTGVFVMYVACLVRSLQDFM